MKQDRQNFFSFWTIFCPFTAPSPLPPPNNPENQNFEKMKKLSGDIIMLHKFTINVYHMVYGSWDMKCTRVNFSVILVYFFFFFFFFFYFKAQKKKN